MTDDGGRRTEDRGRRAEGGGQMTDDGRRRAEGGGQMTDDGRRKTEDGRRRTLRLNTVEGLRCIWGKQVSFP